MQSGNQLTQALQQLEIKAGAKEALKLAPYLNKGGFHSKSAEIFNELERTKSPAFLAGFKNQIDQMYQTKEAEREAYLNERDEFSMNQNMLSHLGLLRGK